MRTVRHFVKKFGLLVGGFSLHPIVSLYGDSLVELGKIVLWYLETQRREWKGCA